MFGKDKLWEARLADLKHEHNRTVDALTAWIEQLQAQVGALNTLPAATPPPQPLAQAIYQSDEESALVDALEMGLISKDDFDQQRAIHQAADAELG